MKPERILGISGFDSAFAVSVVDGGSIAFAIEEEKLRRSRGLGFKHLEAGGSLALDLVLSRLKGGISGVDAAVYVPPIETSPDATRAQASRISAFLERRYGIAPEVLTVGHVSAHFAFERAVHSSADRVLMVGHSRAVCSKRRDDERDFDLEFPVVSFLDRLAQFVGMDGGRIHHLENMARFGEPRFLKALDELLEQDLDPKQLLQVLEQVVGCPRRLPGAELDSVHYDFAASLHGVLRRRIKGLLRSIPAIEDGAAIALCGGVFQSWSLNDALADEFPNDRFLVSFAPGNPACAIGGPLAVRDAPPVEPLEPFLGPEYTRDEIKSVLDNAKARYQFLSFNQILDTVSAALQTGKMVGWFSGRCEFGNRALGSRSVFANPASPYACENLSSYLKLRPAYFAYAVSMAGDRPEASGIQSPYLSRSTHLPEYFGDSPVRLQTVSQSSTPVLHRLIEAFHERTGVPGLLNTSLNYFGEPIACTPRDALKTFYASGLDMLVMENFVLGK